MDAAEIAVLVSSALAAGAVAWYFMLGDRRGQLASADAGGVQRIKIRVQGGYHPSAIQVLPNRPVRIDFYRDETDSCSETVVFGEYGISTNLQPFKTTSVTFTPEKTGRFPFHCGMNMLHGTLIVSEEEHE